MNVYTNRDRVIDLEFEIEELKKELDKEQTENSTFRDENKELDSLREERDRLAYENKNMAEFIKYNDSTLDDTDVGDIATGTPDVWKRYKHAGFLECMEALKSLPTIAEEK